MLPLQVRVDMWDKISKFSKLHDRSLTLRLFCVILGHSLGGPYLSAKMQSEYSTAQADWAD